jgi:hypothetical protein
MARIRFSWALGVIFALSLVNLLWISPRIVSYPTDGAMLYALGIDTLPKAASQSSESGMNTLYPGELPGYTGWPRPAMTLASSFWMLRRCSSTTKVNVNWTCSVHCSHEACQNGGSLFYVRAYGPAILPGIVTDHHNGTYDVAFNPLDKGTYTVEVVLTFSDPLPFSKFPMKSRTEPAYEGYMLPAFPLTVSVTEPYSLASLFGPKGSLPLCTISDLLESSPTSALETGRWVVAEKMVDRPFSRDSHVFDQNGSITLDGYQRGDNSIGFRMDYRPAHCSLLDEAAIKGEGILQECQNKSKIDFSNRFLHLILVGDSNIREQGVWAHGANLFGGQFKTTVVDTKGGINVMLPNVTRDLTEIIQNDKKIAEERKKTIHYVMIFNSGLHDIIHLCGSEYYGLQINFTARGDARCIDTYRQRLREFAHLMKQFPSALTVFQTTSAAWPKWGLFATAWPADRKQSLPFSSSFAEYFNEIAWEVMKEFDIPVMDTYWLTLSRPDHREVSVYNDIIHKMAHSGPEVYSVLARKWAMMILGTICPSAPLDSKGVPPTL